MQLIDDHLRISGQETSGALVHHLLAIGEWLDANRIAIPREGMAGINRLLTRARDYARAFGRSVDVRLIDDGGNLVVHVEPLGKR